MKRFRSTCAPTSALCAAAVAAAGFCSSLRAIDIDGVQPAAADQPQINAIVYVGDNTTPQVGTVTVTDWDTFTDSTGSVFNVQGYLDTGASGILISTPTNTTLNIPVSSTLYYDVGVAGSDAFQVSQDVRISIANFYQNRTDLDQFDALNHPITAPYMPILNPGSPNNKVRLQVGPYHPSIDDPSVGALGDTIDQLKQLLGTNDLGSPFDEIEQLISELNAVDVIGMPAMRGRVVVIDPSRVNNLNDFLNNIDTVTDLPDVFIHTYVYNPGTVYNPLTKDTDPGIPVTSHHVKLTYASFDRFTQLSPGAGAGPTLAHNPFIGKDPVALMDGITQPDTPGITITRGTASSQGNWLLDTGAAASMISTAQAAKLNVFYKVGTFNTDTPQLVDELGNLIPNQFTIEIGGIGGQINVAGFFLDSLLLPTIEGLSNPNQNIKFLNAPVLVNDISLKDPVTGKILTLDGIFGMNFLVSSTSIDSTDPLAGLAPVPGAFDWITFDEPNGILGLDLDPAIFNLQTFANANSQTVSTNITGTGGVTQSGNGTTTLMGTNTYVGITTVSAGVLIIGTNASLPLNAVVNLTGGKMSLTAGMNAIKLSSLTIAGTPTAPAATLDIKDAGVVITYTTAAAGAALLATTYQQVIAARGTKNINGISLYDGKGITSSTAAANNLIFLFDKFYVGVINNADLAAIGLNAPYTTFKGQTGIPVNAILVRYTYAGDINLDGTINIDDYNYIDSAFGGLLPGYSGQIIGDFNNDGLINIDDYNVIDTGFGFQGLPLSNGDLTALDSGNTISPNVAPVPEPGTALLVLPACAFALQLRKRRRGRA